MLARSSPNSKNAPSPAAKKIRKEMAIEAQYRRYLHLECGHYGAREDTDTLMRSLRPDKDSWWCDVEGKWTILRQENIEKIPLPEKAPF